MEGLRGLKIHFQHDTREKIEEVGMLKPLMGVKVSPEKGHKAKFVVMIPRMRPKIEIGTGSNDRIGTEVEELEVGVDENGSEMPFRIDRRPWKYGNYVGKWNEEIETHAMGVGRRKRWWKYFCIPCLLCL